MVKLELSTEDARLLAEVLDAELRDLSYEIANTDAKDFRDVLKIKRAVVARTLEVLGTAPE